MIRLFCIFVLINNANFEPNKEHCRERNRLVENRKGDLYALIEATLYEKLKLQCNYCGEKDDGKPKLWYKIDDIGSPIPHELRLEMSNNGTKNRVHVNSAHTLTIHNFTQNDTGLYYCKRFEGEDQEKHNFLVDLVHSENVSSLETGNITDWRKYYEEYFLPVNILFTQSEGKEFKYVREELKLEMEIFTMWDIWGICQVCGRPQNEGIKKRTGYCRIRLNNKNSSAVKVETPESRFIENVDIVACRSKILGRILPGISNLTRIIPNFVHSEKCEGTCNPDAEGFNRGWKAGKTSAFKYRKSVVLAEHSHLTLVCPESTLENKVIWKRNGKVLEAGQRVPPKNPEEEPRIMVDTFNTLYLVNVKESEEGNYTCQVDDIRMQQVKVFVVSKSKLLTQAFVRHMMYLCLVLSLTLPCYCAGLVIACCRRRRFKTYEELKEEAEERHGIGNMRLP